MAQSEVKMASNSSPRGDLDLPSLLPMVRRMGESRLDDPDTIDDVVQETLTRLLEVRGRLEQRSLLCYAAITARNLIISLERSRDLEDRHAPRLFEPRDPDRPDDHLLRDEDRKAVVAALAQLSARDRSLVVGHDAWGASTAELGRSYNMSAGAVATHLTRLRGQLRLDYVLALRQMKLPTARCRPVLLALSVRDKRRQRLLDAAGHLLECSTCASLSEPLIARRRTLAPLLVVGEALRRAASGVRAHAGQAGVAAGITAVIVGALWLAKPSGQPQTPDRAALIVGGEPVFSARGPSLAQHEGERALATGVQVLSVPSDEGFWVGPNPRNRVWVKLRGSGESPFQVKPGQLLSFVGKVVSNPRGLVERMRLGPGEGSTTLRRHGYHIAVLETKLELR